MRYYKIVITDPTTGNVIRSDSNPDPSSTYTSYRNGQTIPGALNIEMDLPVSVYALPMGASYIRIYGISLKEIGQAAPTLNFKNIQVFAGMQKGLPLANPALAGLIAQGQIFQALGNWVGTDMTLDLFLQPRTGSPDAPANIVINWKAGTPLSTAIAATLSAAFPGVQQSININPNLVLPGNAVGAYRSLTAFANWVKQQTKAIAPVANYRGVDIFFSGLTITVDDGTVAKPVKDILFQDLIGQPTWISAPIIQFKCPIRADLKIGDIVKMPPVVVVTTAPAASSLLNLKSAFQGTFQIQQMRHVGCYRRTDPESWVTTIDAFPTQLTA